MQTREDILKLIEDYLSTFPVETERAALIKSFVTEHYGAALFDRKNFSGHLTASAFILNQEGTHLLLLKHKVLNRWLQPGGHIDITDESLEFAARREAQEETGISLETLNSIYKGVFDFDSHLIPENTKKQELPHYHHDVRYLFRSLSNLVTIDALESTGHKWIPLRELADDPDFGGVVQKIQRVKEF